MLTRHNNTAHQKMLTRQDNTAHQKTQTKNNQILGAFSLAQSEGNKQTCQAMWRWMGKQQHSQIIQNIRHTHVFVIVVVVVVIVVCVCVCVCARLPHSSAKRQAPSSSVSSRRTGGCSVPPTANALSNMTCTQAKPDPCAKYSAAVGRTNSKRNNANTGNKVSMGHWVITRSKMGKTAGAGGAALSRGLASIYATSSLKPDIYIYMCVCEVGASHKDKNRKGG